MRKTSLEKYSRKRKFEFTPEPAALKFVVQKHNARSLHYDFRLEAGGVLKSWAVPKGISDDPEVKRLAVQVEDHPIEYAEFHGVIPAGNYGAGTVDIWDKGTYFVDPDYARSSNEQSILNGLEKGHINFFLKGEKLSGEYSLVHMKNPATAGRQDKDNKWLIIKKKDSHLIGKSGITDDELRLLGANKAKMPLFFKPMLAEAAEKPFDSADWYFEIKWDGYRALAFIKNGKVKLYSRNKKLFNAYFPVVIDSLSRISDAVIDGEIVVLDETGRPSFQLLQDYMKSREGILVYYIFDIIYYRGFDLSNLSLSQRSLVLNKVFPELPHLKISGHVEKDGIKFYESARTNGLEGIMAKRLDSLYHPGVRSRDWLKLKILNREEAVICGFTKPRGSRGFFGSLVLGMYKDKKLEFIGQVGTGFDESSLEEIYKKLKPLVTGINPFGKEITGLRQARRGGQVSPPWRVTWVRPELLCEIKFSEWTREGKMRMPVFLGLRLDKKARDDRVHPTNLQKIFWPEEKYTKGMLIEYYYRVAPYMLKYLKDRPESMNRFPDGIEGESFYQKNAGEIVPDWIQTIKIFSESEKKEIDYLVCNDEVSLIFMVNLGCIEINPWNSRINSLSNPDYAVFDLDPEDIPFTKVVETALFIHNLLDEIGASNYCKTSGGRGLHIYVPLNASYSYDQAREFVHIISLITNKNMPGITSLEQPPEKRGKKVYLDFRQNARSKTMAAVYSIRPRKGAPVSTPLLWNELKPDLSPLDFTIKTIDKRINEKGDLWEGLLRKNIDMNKCLENLYKLFPGEKSQ
ncbi:MAG: DNA ligase D [bacterium]|nr:DNA ligase D [bacterium]